jgi:hypothetical protein
MRPTRTFGLWKIVLTHDIVAAFILKAESAKNN